MERMQKLKNRISFNTTNFRFVQGGGVYEVNVGENIDLDAIAAFIGNYVGTTAKKVREWSVGVVKYGVIGTPIQVTFHPTGLVELFVEDWCKPTSVQIVIAFDHAVEAFALSSCLPERAFL